MTHDWKPNTFDCVEYTFGNIRARLTPTCLVGTGNLMLMHSQPNIYKQEWNAIMNLRPAIFQMLMGKILHSSVRGCQRPLK